MRTNKKTDLARQLINDGVSADVDEIRNHLIRIQTEVLSDTDNAGLLSDARRNRFAAVSSTLKYTIPTSDADSESRWAKNLAKTMLEERRLMYPNLFKSKEDYEKGTGRKLRKVGER
jgi:CRISPR/Cas system CMR-associated protein Cmr5 small subunit